MYEFRSSIREGVSVSFKVVQSTLEKLWKALAREVLKSKDPHDGQNLLVYAASWGRADWFLSLAENLVCEVGHGYRGIQLPILKVGVSSMACCITPS